MPALGLMDTQFQVGLRNFLPNSHVEVRARCSGSACATVSEHDSNLDGFIDPSPSVRSRHRGALAVTPHQVISDSFAPLEALRIDSPD
jgi:hypothetical protein